MCVAGRVGGELWIPLLGVPLGWGGRGSGGGSSPPRLHRVRLVQGAAVSRFARTLGVSPSPLTSTASGAVAAPPPKPPAKSLPSALDVGAAVPGPAGVRPPRQGVTAFAQLMVSHYKVGSGRPGPSSATATAASPSTRRAGPGTGCSTPRTPARRPSPTRSSPGCLRPTPRAGPVRWRGASASTTSSGTRRCGGRTPPSAAGPPTPGPRRTPTTSTSRSPGTAPTSGRRGGPAAPSRRSTPARPRPPEPDHRSDRAVRCVCRAGPGQPGPDVALAQRVIGVAADGRSAPSPWPR